MTVRIRSALLLAGLLSLLPDVVSAQRTTQLRVLVYNIHYGQGTDGKYDIPRLAKVISAAKPDLVALQEVDVGVRRSGGLHEAQQLSKLTGLAVRYGPTQHYQGGLFGNAVLSRFPIKNVVIQPLPYTESSPSLTTYPRGAIGVTVQLPTGDQAEFISTHFQHNVAEDRLAEAKAINAKFGKKRTNGKLVLLAGDMNATPESEPIAELLKQWENAIDKDAAPTAPSTKPRSRIDYVFYQRHPKLKLVESKVIAEPVASDHCPVLAVFEISAEVPDRADRRTRVSQQIVNGLNSKLNVTYARYGDRTLEMDIYRPKNAWCDLPAIVCIHGGGWAKGNRTSHAHVAQALAARGFVTATISYRLSGEAPFPAQIHDCKAAVRYLRANAKQYGIKSEKIGAIGLSAGGHLTALLASSGDVKELEGDGGNAEVSSSIQAAVPMGAQTHLMSARNRAVSALEDRGRIWRQFLNGTQEQNPATYRLASPIEHLDKNDPACWFITGENDDASTHANEFRKKAIALGRPTGLSVIKNAPHGFLGKQIWFDQMVDLSSAFFSKTLE